MGRRSARSRQATDSTERARDERRQSGSDRSRTTRAEAQHRYGLDLEEDADLLRLRRLEEQFGQRQVRAWQQEGIPLQAMGDADGIARFREREGTPVPWNVEAENDASVQRSTEAAADADAAPAGEAQVPDTVRDVIASRGQALDASIQRAMEERMGDSLGDVRIHTGPQAAQACEDVNARAFTVGNHVAFDAGEYDPSSPEGQHVLAHELAHVRQQTSGTLSMLPKENLQLEIDPDPALERDAEQTAQRVMEGGELGIQRLRGTEVYVQRLDEDQVFEAMALFEAENDSGEVSEFRQSQNENRLAHLYDAASDVLEKRDQQRQLQTTQAMIDAESPELREFGRAGRSPADIQNEIDQLSRSVDASLDDVAVTEDQRAALRGDIETDRWDEVSWTTVKAILSVTTLGAIVPVAEIASKAADVDVDEVGQQAVGRLRRGEVSEWADLRRIWKRTSGTLEERAAQIEREVREGTWIDVGEDPYPGGDE